MLNDCEATLRQVCTALDTELVEFNGEADHVHLLVQYPPKVAVSGLVRRLKGASAHRCARTTPGACNRARMHGQFWTPSCFAVSAGGAPLSVLRQFIENQERPPEGGIRLSPD
jgi:putative transposase